MLSTEGLTITGRALAQQVQSRKLAGMGHTPTATLGVACPLPPGADMARERSPMVRLRNSALGALTAERLWGAVSREARARNAARNRADVMEIVANSPSDRRQVGQQKHPQRSSVTKPSTVALRGCADARTSSRRASRISGGEDNCSAAERSIGDTMHRIAPARARAGKARRPPFRPCHANARRSRLGRGHQYACGPFPSRSQPLHCQAGVFCGRRNSLRLTQGRQPIGSNQADMRTETDRSLDIHGAGRDNATLRHPTASRADRLLAPRQKA
jgi:hypothetical protein